MRQIPKSLAFVKPQLVIGVLISLVFGLETSLAVRPNHDSLLSQSSAGSTEDATIQKARAIVQDFANGNYEEARAILHPSLQAEWSADKLEGIWENLIDKIGNVSGVLEAKIINTFMGDIVYVCTSFERYSPNCSESVTNFVVTFNQENEIVGIDFPKVESIGAIAEQFINDLGKGDFAAARGYFHPNLKEEIFPQQLQQTWEEKERALGEFRELQSITYRPGSNADRITILEVSMAFTNGVARVLIIFDEDKRIVNINFFE